MSYRSCGVRVGQLSRAQCFFSFFPCRPHTRARVSEKKASPYLDRAIEALLDDSHRLLDRRRARVVMRVTVFEQRVGDERVQHGKQGGLLTTQELHVQ